MSPAAAFSLAVPLYLLILIGYLLARGRRVPDGTSEALSRFVFTIAIPALMLQITTDLANMPPVDARLLLPYFCACLVVFALARLIGAWRFRLDGVAQTVFGMASIYGNTVLIGVPVARAVLGPQALPALALILVAHTIFMWLLAMLSVEWARGGRLNPRGIGRMLLGVVSNPVVASILIGSAWGMTGIALPGPVRRTLELLAQSAVPLALVTVGMGLAAYRIRDGLPQALAICALKLLALPLTVWLLARAVGLPPLEMAVVMLLSSIALGVNAYLMSREFGALGGPVGTALLLSNAVSAVTTPLVIALFAPG